MFFLTSIGCTIRIKKCIYDAFQKTVKKYIYKYIFKKKLYKSDNLPLICIALSVTYYEFSVAYGRLFYGMTDIQSICLVGHNNKINVYVKQDYCIILL